MVLGEAVLEPSWWALFRNMAQLLAFEWSPDSFESEN